MQWLVQVTDWTEALAGAHNSQVWGHCRQYFFRDSPARWLDSHSSHRENHNMHVLGLVADVCAVHNTSRHTQEDMTASSSRPTVDGERLIREWKEKQVGFLSWPSFHRFLYLQVHALKWTYSINRSWKGFLNPAQQSWHHLRTIKTIQISLRTFFQTSRSLRHLQTTVPTPHVLMQLESKINLCPTHLPPYSDTSYTNQRLTQVCKMSGLPKEIRRFKVISNIKI